MFTLLAAWWGSPYQRRISCSKYWVVTAPRLVTDISGWTNQDVKNGSHRSDWRQCVKKAFRNSKDNIDWSSRAARRMEQTLKLKNMFDLLKFREELDKLLGNKSRWHTVQYCSTVVEQQMLNEVAILHMDLTSLKELPQLETPAIIRQARIWRHEAQSPPKRPAITLRTQPNDSPNLQPAMLILPPSHVTRNSKNGWLTSFNKWQQAATCWTE